MFASDNFNKNILFIVFILFIFSFNILAGIQEEIDNRIKIKYGNDYFIQNVYDINILESSINYPIPHKITDFSRTLVDCYVFTAKVDNRFGSKKGVVGIYKDNNVIWDSDTIIYSYLVDAITLFNTYDINNDGKIEITISTQSFGIGAGEERLYIFSWDGLIGNLISDIDPLGESVIVSLTSIANFEILDVNGDGVFELRGLWYDNNNEDDDNEYFKTYSWNGMLYGYWDNVPQLNDSSFLPRSSVEVSISTNVTKVNNEYKYKYTITNSLSSKQDINAFYLNKLTEKIDNIVKRKSWSFFYEDELITWQDLNNPLYQNPNFIKKGYSDSSNSFISSDLPGIINYFIQGFNFDPSINTFSPSERYSNILQNSVNGLTIGPLKILNPFIPLDFIDSILNYIQHSFELNWIKNQPTRDKYANHFTTAKTQLQQNNIAAVKNTLNQVLQDVDQDSTSNLTSEAYALLRYNTEYLLNNLPEVAAGFIVKLNSSSGNLLAGGSLEYYEGGWKDAVDNGNGTFSITTDKQTLSLRMNYEFGSQTVSNVPSQNNTYTFRTVNTKVQLKNSSGNLISEEGSVQYYAGGWRDFGSTINGTVSKELLPGNYSFRITYGYASNDKQQDIGINPSVVFQTVNTAVQLQNSQGQLIDEGTIKYYSGGWRDFGTTINGVSAKELLPANYSFRMTYAYASNDKQQNIGDNSIVIFQTVNAAVQLKNSQGQFIDQGNVKYYAGGWRDFGSIENGVSSKELLPNNYSFRMTNEYISNDKQQNIGANNIVDFSTVLCRVIVSNAQGAAINNADVKYYAGGWRQFGITINGEASKELLPSNITFRGSFNGVSRDKQQNTGENTTVGIILP